MNHRLIFLALLLTGCASPVEPPAPDRLTAAAPTAAAEPLTDWPPRLGQPFPDPQLHDRNGNPIRLSSLAGKVLLVEPIGMNCPACNAFAGANRAGKSGYEGTRPQANLLSVEEMLPAYAGGVTVDHPDLVIVHLLLYNMKMRAPTRDDARRWAAHFGIDASNHLVVYADERFIGPASYELIPGFQLVDRDRTLRADSTGHHPRDDLYTVLLPLLGRLLRGS